MGARIGSFLATLMLSIPLAAVGLMAVFGVPQLTPVNAAPDADGIVRSPPRFAWPGLLGQGTQRSSQQVDQSDAPFFSPTQDPRDSAYAGPPPDRSQSAVEFGSPRAGWGTRDEGSRDDRDPRHAHWDNRDHAALPHRANEPSQRPDPWSEREGESPPSRDFGAPHRSPAHAAVSSPSARPASLLDPPPARLSWRQAALRLSEMGIENYHLEKGSTAETFLFVCSYSPNDTPHVTHRFESEADEPLVAVNNVLSQMEHWMQERFAAENFPSRERRLSPSSETLLR